MQPLPTQSLKFSTSQVWLGFIGITYRATFFAGPQSDVESK